MLDCEHTFCRRCVESMASRCSGSGVPASVTCPTCSRATLLPAGGTDKLRTNSTVVKMLELLMLFCPQQQGSTEASALNKARREIKQDMRNLEVKEAKAREDASAFYSMMLRAVERRRDAVFQEIDSIANVQRQMLQSQDEELRKAELEVARLQQLKIVSADAGSGFQLTQVQQIMSNLRSAHGGSLFEPVETCLAFLPPDSSALDAITSSGKLQSLRSSPDKHAAFKEEAEGGGGEPGQSGILPEGTVVKMLYDDGVWYSGWIEKYCGHTGRYVVSFPDGDVQVCVCVGERCVCGGWWVSDRVGDVY